MGVREVTRNTSAVFDQVSNGDTIVVTNRGRVVGIITPPQEYSPQLAELIAQGRDAGLGVVLSTASGAAADRVAPVIASARTWPDRE